jgi:hypothetical protein
MFISQVDIAAEIVRRCLLICCILIVAYIAGCGDSSSALIGKWSDYSTYKYGDERVEFFEDKTCYLQTDKRFSCRWSVLDDGRIKITFGVSSVFAGASEVTILGELDGDELILDAGRNSKSSFVRDGSSRASEIQTAIADAVRAREIKAEAERRALAEKQRIAREARERERLARQAAKEQKRREEQAARARKEEEARARQARYVKATTPTATIGSIIHHSRYHGQWKITLTDVNITDPGASRGSPLPFARIREVKLDRESVYKNDPNAKWVIVFEGPSKYTGTYRRKIYCAEGESCKKFFKTFENALAVWQTKHAEFAVAN